MKIKNVGEQIHRFRVAARNEYLVFAPGEEKEVSVPIGEKLLGSYPDRFQLIGEPGERKQYLLLELESIDPTVTMAQAEELLAVVGIPAMQEALIAQRQAEFEELRDQELKTVAPPKKQGKKAKSDF